jgi:hypothetical protein
MLTGSHDASQLPVVILGGTGGRLKTGRVLDYKEKPDRDGFYGSNNSVFRRITFP